MASRAADSRDRCRVLRDGRLHDESLPDQDGRCPVETSRVRRSVVVARRAPKLKRAIPSRPPAANREADADRESHRSSRAPLPFEDASVDPRLDARGDRPRAANSRDRCGILRDDRLHDESLPNEDGTLSGRVVPSSETRGRGPRWAESRTRAVPSGPPAATRAAMLVVNRVTRYGLA